MEQTLTPTYLRSVVRRRALYFLVPLLVGSAATVGVVMSLPAVYRSTATILVESQQIPADLIRSTITALASERLQVIEQRIMARDNILKIARKFNLLADKTTLSTTDLVERVKKRIVIEQMEANVNSRRGSERLTVAFRVAYEDENPATAAAVANELVTSILSEDVKSRTSLAAETTRFLDKEAQSLAASLDAVEGKLSAFRLQNADALPEKLQFNMGQLEKTQKNMVDIERELLTIDQDKRFLSFEHSVRVATAQGVTSPGGKDDLQSQINTLKSQLASFATIYSENHPEMRMRRKALEALEAQKAEIDKAIKAAASIPAPDEENLSIDEQLAAQKIKSLDDRSAFLKDQLSELSKTAEELRKSLDDMTEKLAQARLSQRLEQDQQAERFEVIEQPIQPQEPTSPNRPKLMGLGGAMAAALGGGLALALEFFDDTIRTVAGFEARTGLRPISVIPYITNGAERRSRWRRIVLLTLGGILIAALALAAVHFLYRPLDDIYYRILLKLRALSA
jgi:succinoglycan biosynthesis transport protein ExoP